MPIRNLRIGDLCRFQNSQKRIISQKSWRLTNSTLRSVWSIEVDGVVEQGLTLLAACSAERPEENVAIVLRVEVGLKPLAFSRIDWRNKPHDNRQAVCGVYRHMSAGRTHFHDPNLHEDIDVNSFFEMNIPIALPIEPEPTDFCALLDISAKLLHIDNLSDIEAPPWAPRTLHT